ncbi:prepilin-type N-terminal cleavage/methylation domain-containing protein [Mesobacillus selenatarsenatis]|uniref:Prepilin-type N-terminal cleavage/methylation domain-containing protein n=1 Tax=Mesobacillus selenatarsenatis TaxID=388741 RepID=A0A846TXH4_9BACI|nr:prepilin-type N-terminal cleavage/methylation domain-containing protein [Mesobacillus selenatarsenatis]NKE06386.1 prepilin-type N-terminal cleavage/methylation domain-containing protein [Mesobacillus selenatarsenatis]
MFKALKEKLKDQRGLTLIELLAVIVILGIIAAIAIPSIGAIINNSKADAHLANAQQIANAARLYVTTEKIEVTTTAKSIEISTLVDKGLLENIKDPSGSGNYNSASAVAVKKETGGDISYKVTLKSSDATPVVYLTGSKDTKSLVRDDVTNE